MSDIQEVSVDDLKHLVSDRAIQGETMLLNMGPASLHAWVLRLLLELDGETVINCIPTSVSCIPASRRIWKPKPTRRPRSCLTGWII